MAPQLIGSPLPLCISPALPEEDEKPKDKEEISAEDKALQEGLELAVERARDSSGNVQLAALEHLRKEIRASTSSMTSVPKPLKFLRPHYGTLKEVSQQGGGENQDLGQSFGLLFVLSAIFPHYLTVV